MNKTHILSAIALFDEVLDALHSHTLHSLCPTIPTEERGFYYFLYARKSIKLKQIENLLDWIDADRLFSDNRYTGYSLRKNIVSALASRHRIVKTNHGYKINKELI